MSAEIRDAIRVQALSMGFDAVGFAAAHLAEEARDNLGEFVARGYHGDMGWLADTAARRGDPQVLWPEARTVVVLAVNYGSDGDPLGAAGDPECGEISVYARGRDYHDTVKKRLSLQGNPNVKADWFVNPKTNEEVTFIDFARSEGRFSKQFDNDGRPSETLLMAKQDRLENWRLLQELAGLR